MQNQHDAHRFGKHSGALIVASATSDFSQVSANGGDENGEFAGTAQSSGLHTDGRNPANDIKIMTGAYSLNKNSVVNDKIFSESFMRENQTCADQDQFYGTLPADTRAGTATAYQKNHFVTSIDESDGKIESGNTSGLQHKGSFRHPNQNGYNTGANSASRSNNGSS